MLWESLEATISPALSRRRSLADGAYESSRRLSVGVFRLAQPRLSQQRPCRHVANDAPFTTASSGSQSGGVCSTTSATRPEGAGASAGCDPFKSDLWPCGQAFLAPPLPANLSAIRAFGTHVVSRREITNDLTRRTCHQRPPAPEGQRPTLDHPGLATCSARPTAEPRRSQVAEELRAPTPQSRSSPSRCAEPAIARLRNAGIPYSG